MGFLVAWLARGAAQTREEHAPARAPNIDWAERRFARTYMKTVEGAAEMLTKERDRKDDPDS